MLIKIYNSLKPFSHAIPFIALLPETKWIVKIYPNLISFEDIEDVEKNGLNVFLDIKGPIENFTAILDLEKFKIKVFGSSLEGYFSYHIVAEDKKVLLFLEKGPKKGIAFDGFFKKGVLFAKDKLALPLITSEEIEQDQKENLFLGMNKALDMDLIQRRKDLKEIFPLWLKIAQGLKNVSKTTYGTAKLLLECRELIEKQDKVHIEKTFLSLFKTGFFGILVPRLNDDQYQGIIPVEKTKTKDSPLYLLKEGERLIKSLFFQEKQETFAILPCLPVGFYSGRFLNINSSYGVLDIEWSKKLLRRMIFKPNKDFELKLILQKPIESFRLRINRKEKGKIYHLDEVMPMKKNTIYFFDNFQK